jgi:uncharacterized protein DUF2878
MCIWRCLWERSLEVRLVGLATAVGVVVEMMQIAGTYRFISGTVLDALPPPWLLPTWAQLSMTFRYSLRNVITRPIRAVLFGAAAQSFSIERGGCPDPPPVTTFKMRRPSPAPVVATATTS